MSLRQDFFCILLVFFLGAPILLCARSTNPLETSTVRIQIG